MYHNSYLKMFQKIDVFSHKRAAVLLKKKIKMPLSAKHIHIHKRIYYALEGNFHSNTFCK